MIQIKKIKTSLNFKSVHIFYPTNPTATVQIHCENMYIYKKSTPQLYLTKLSNKPSGQKTKSNSIKNTIAFLCKKKIFHACFGIY